MGALTMLHDLGGVRMFGVCAVVHVRAMDVYYLLSTFFFFFLKMG